MSTNVISKLKSRFTATRFEFTVTAHVLQPWPCGSKALAIGWQRGKKRRGATNSVFPAPSSAGKLATIVRFNEKFTVPATLYKAPGADKNNPLGPYKKKCLILAILETDGSTNATAALGRVVIDLSEYAALDGQEIRSFQVACNKAISAAVGEPVLTVTIRSRWKKAGANFTDDEIASMSTDTTGSDVGLGANLASFLRFKGKGNKDLGRSRGREQDLKGFGTAAMEPALDAVQEDEGDDDDEGRLRSPSDASGPLEGPTDMVKSWLRKDTVAAAEYDFSGTMHIHDDSDEDGTLSTSAVGRFVREELRSSRRNLTNDEGPLRAGLRARTPPAEPPGSYRRVPQRLHVKSPGLPAGPGSGPMTPSRSSRSKWRMEAVGSTPVASKGSPPYPGPPTPMPNEVPKKQGGYQQEEDMGDAHLLLESKVQQLQDELLMSAATEVSLYLGQRCVSGKKVRTRQVHAPARRIARTLVCLGRNDGIPFGRLALRLIEAMVTSNRQDLNQLAYWWSNCVHLRGFLQSLNLTMDRGLGHTNVVLHWSSEAFVPELNQLEKKIFDEVVGHMWHGVLVPLISAPKGRAAANHAAMPRHGGNEAAIRKWLQGLEEVNSHLLKLYVEGHVNMLRQQVLLQMLQRIDNLLFYYLIKGATLTQLDPSESGSSVATPTSVDVSEVASLSSTAVMQSRLIDPSQPFLPLLDDAMLMFPRGGALTFGVGMNLKMTVTRIQQWAFAEGGLREVWAQLPETGQVLFPLLRAAADLLMMPKDLLMDESIRSDACSALSMPTIMYILNHFKTDEFAQDGISEEILECVKADANGLVADEVTQPLVEVESEVVYYSPTDDIVMTRVEAGEEPGLEYDADSEAELDAIGEVNSCNLEGAPQQPLRYRLLHTLWANGVPRSRKITLQRSEE